VKTILCSITRYDGTVASDNSEQSAKQSRLQMVFKMSTVTVSVHTRSQSSTLLITMLF